MRRLVVFTMFMVIVLVMPTLCLGAENENRKTGEANKDAKNIQIEINIILSEEGQNDKIYKHAFNMVSDEEFEYISGTTVPYNPSSKTGNKEFKESSITFIDIGSSISLRAVVVNGDLIILRSQVEISKVDSMTEDGIPLVSTFAHKGVSAHKDAELIKIVSGDYIQADQTIALYIKAELV